MVGSLRTGLAWMVTLLVLSLATVEMPHLGAQHHDVDFDLIVVVHDGSAHHVGGGAPERDARPDHCLACHWGRAFRPGLDSRLLDSPADETRLAGAPDPVWMPRHAPVAQPPLRSPPSTSILS
jgi:hypothetical protein